MTENERILLITLAGLACSELAANRPDDNPQTDTMLRMQIHKLLILMRDICTEKGYMQMFTEDQMDRMTR
jgi:hypothetical protein